MPRKRKEKRSKEHCNVKEHKNHEGIVNELRVENIKQFQDRYNEGVIDTVELFKNLLRT